MKTRIRKDICPLHGQQRFYLKGKSYICLRCSADTVVEFRVRRKLKIISLCGGQCVVCGYDRHYGALEFHHLDPASKEFGLGQTGSATMAIERLVPELNKCIMVCANCHREIEGGLIPSTQVTHHRIALSVADFYPDKRVYCLCGCQISNGAQQCTRCCARSQERIRWPDIEELIQRVDRTSYCAVARELGVSDNAIRKRIKNHAPLV